MGPQDATVRQLSCAPVRLIDAAAFALMHVGVGTCVRFENVAILLPSLFVAICLRAACLRFDTVNSVASISYSNALSAASRHSHAFM